MSIGEAWKDFMGSMNKEQSFKLMDAFVEAGGNAIDTANNYRKRSQGKMGRFPDLEPLIENEESEEWIGDWMEARGNRDQMVIATKFTTRYASILFSFSIHI
jgi:aryl-alcohol dehydrogenase-like predicted oxidoreductase